MNKKRRLRVAFIGDGEQAERWAAALRRLARVSPPPQELSEAIDALVIAPGASDPFAQAKEALLAGVPVLYAAPFLLSPRQARSLHDLSGRQGLLLRFVEPFQHRPGFAFLRRLLEGEEPFWPSLYLRTLCLAPPDTSTRIDALVTEELALCEALLDGTPQWITAAASRRDAGGEVCATFLTVQYTDGTLAQCTVSLAETFSVRQLVAVTPDRTVVLDDQDPAAPLRIVGSGEQDTYTQGAAPMPTWQSRAEGRPTTVILDPIAEEAKRFLRAVSSNDRSPANGELWTRVAALWWAARQSMSFGGPVEVASAAFPAGDTEPPPLTLIEGGGKPASAAGRRPALTVVSR